ncbi:MAG TPA: DNA-3-methyladenine glycosylase I [Candidatus Saccharimonadales bacterium]|nr:DNA-3-methyladenine glycosylase I [Candidatus Saccharimonadales bacterium]
MPICVWAEASPELRRYHDREWGRAARDDRTLFEFLVLETAQAGLSWATILRKREGYRRAFAGLDPAAVARFTAASERRLLADPGIVRNAAKIRAAIENARRFNAVSREHGSFWRYLSRFRDGSALSSDLRARGFSFTGPVVCTSLLEAVGLLDGHAPGCPAKRPGPVRAPRHDAVRGSRPAPPQ